MLTRTAIALLICAASIPAARAADQGLLGQAPADSEVLIGINVKQIRESNFGKMLVAGPANAQLKAMSAQAGFDPIGDIDEVLIAAPAKQNPSAFLMIRGRFDAAKVSQLAVSGGMTGADYHGVKIMTKAGQSSGFSSLAVLDPSLIVGGDEPAVRAFVDRRGQGPALSAAMAAKAGEASKANDLWVVLHAAPSSFVPPNAAQGPMGDLVRSIEEVTLGLKFGSDITLSLNAVTHTPKDAEGLAAAVRMFSGMAASNQQGNKQVAMLLQKLKVDSDGSTARLSLAIPEAEAEAAIRDSMAGGKAATGGDSTPKQ